MRLYDTHAHLNDEAYAEDLAEVLLRMEEAGIARANVIAYDLPSSEAAVSLAKAHPQVLRAVIGVHPSDSHTWSPEVEKRLVELAAQARENGIVAWGEIGLDYHYENTNRPVQAEVFWRQIELAHEADLPLVIHNRDAHADCLSLLSRARAEGLLREENPGVIHCYSGSVETAAAFLKLGFFLGFDGPITFKNAKQPCACVEAIPLDRLLLETDCPYLTPVPYRGKRNEPARLVHILERAAELRGLTPEAVAEQTWKNALTLFGE